MNKTIGQSKPSLNQHYSHVTHDRSISDMLAVIQRNWVFLSKQAGYYGIQDAIGLYARFGAIDICEEYKKALAHEEDTKNRFKAWQKCHKKTS